MKIYIYKTKDFRWVRYSTSDVITGVFLFKKWRRPYRYLNRLFLPQPESTYPNWFIRLFKNFEVVFHGSDTYNWEDLIEKGFKRGSIELIRVYPAGVASICHD